MNRLDEEILKVLNEDYKGPTGTAHFSKDYPEGYLYDDWNSGIISFQKIDENENMIQIFAPEEEYNNQWGLSIVDGNGVSLIDGATVKGIGDYDVETVSLNANDWNTAKSKIEQIINANPKVKELFGDFEVPAEAIDIMVKWNKLKDAGIKPYEALKAMNII